jgi:predicted PurR-regulated permease PerM
MPVCASFKVFVERVWVPSLGSASCSRHPADPTPLGYRMATPTSDQTPPIAPQNPTARGQRDVTISFNTRSVRRSGIVVLLLVAAFLLALWLFSVTSHFLFLILMAWLIAIALEPGIRALIARGRSRGVSAAIVGGGAVLVIIVLAAVFGGLFFTQIAQFVDSIPTIENSIITWANQHLGTKLDPNSVASSLQLDPAHISSWAGSLSGGVFGVVESMSSVLFDLLTIMVFASYFAADGPRFLRTIAATMPPRAQLVFVNVSTITTEKTGGYVVSKIILAGLSAFFHGIFFFAIGVPYWLPFALFVGITAQFIPLVGTYLGIILPVLATVFTDPWKAVAIIVFATIYQQIESYIFTPRVSKKTMDVNPAIALAAVFVGAAIWGPVGALIGIPLAAAGVAILDSYKTSYDLVPEVDSAIATDGVG